MAGGVPDKGAALRVNVYWVFCYHNPMPSKKITIAAIALLFALTACTPTPSPTTLPAPGSPPLLTDEDAIGVVRAHVRYLASNSEIPQGVFECIKDAELTARYGDGKWIVTSSKACTYIVDDKTGVVTSR